MTNLPHDIMLTLLKGGYTAQNISLDEVIKEFNPPTSEKLKSAYIKDILTSLKNKNYLNWKVCRRLADSDKFAYLDSYKNDFASETATYPFYDLENTHITGSITPEGIDYAIDIDRKRLQHRNNYLAIVFAGMTVFLTGISLYKTISTQSDTDKKLQIWQMKLQSQDSLLQNSTGRLDSLIQATKEDSLKH